MSMVPLCLRAAVAAMSVASPSVAGDAPVVATRSERAAAPSPFDHRLGQEPGGLGLRRPDERSKFPVVLIHGLWGNPPRRGPETDTGSIPCQADISTTIAGVSPGPHRRPQQPRDRRKLTLQTACALSKRWHGNCNCPPSASRDRVVDHRRS